VKRWIGGQKATRLEADGILPFVSTSPFMNFFYAHPAAEGPRIPLRRSQKTVSVGVEAGGANG
jgi:uncharacterized membrane protein YkgB